jgi:hypothetical protein
MTRLNDNLREGKAAGRGCSWMGKAGAPDRISPGSPEARAVTGARSSVDPGTANLIG